MALYIPGSAFSGFHDLVRAAGGVVDKLHENHAIFLLLFFLNVVSGDYDSLMDLVPRLLGWLVLFVIFARPAAAHHKQLLYYSSSRIPADLQGVCTSGMGGISQESWSCSRIVSAGQFFYEF